MQLIINNLYTQTFGKNNKTQPSIFSLYLMSLCAENRGSSCHHFWWFPVTLSATFRLPRLSLAAIYHAQLSKSLKTALSSLQFKPKVRYIKTLTCYILSFQGYFGYEYSLYDQIDSYYAIFIDFGDVQSYGYLIKNMIK